MGRHKKELTQEQIDFRNSILKRKINSVKVVKKFGLLDTVPKVLTPEDELQKCFWYMDNCVYWLNQYIEGRESMTRLLETAIAIQGNAKKMEQIIKQKLNAEP